VLFFSIGVEDNYNKIIELRVNLFINGHKYTFYIKKFIGGSSFVSDHIYLFYLDLEGLVRCLDNYEKLESTLEEALSKNEWIHTELKLDSYIKVHQELHRVERKLHSTKFGIHVVKVENNLKDIQFTNPYRKSNTSLSKFLPLLKKQRIVDMEVIETEHGQHQQHKCIYLFVWLFFLLYFVLEDTFFVSFFKPSY